MIEFMIKNTDFSMAIIALGSFWISVFAFGVSIYTAYLQRKQSRLSVTPLLHIFGMDYNDEIGLEIANNGLGSMIVREIWFENEKNQKRKSLIDLMPQDIEWKEYLYTNHLFSIPAGDKICIIKIFPKDDREREEARKALKNIRVHVEYADLYRKKYYMDIDLAEEYTD